MKLAIPTAFERMLIYRIIIPSYHTISKYNSTTVTIRVFVTNS